MRDKTKYLYTTKLEYKDKIGVGVDFIDVSYESGLPYLAPPEKLNRSREQLSEEVFEEKFLKCMRDRFKSNRYLFKEVLEGGAKVLACSCSHGETCHRRVLVSIISKVAKELGIEVKYSGEII